MDFEKPGFEMIQAFALPSVLISDKVRSLFAGTSKENFDKLKTLTFKFVVCFGGGGEATGEGARKVTISMGVMVSVGGMAVSVGDGIGVAVSVGGIGVEVKVGTSVGGTEVAVFAIVLVFTGMTLGACVAARELQEADDTEISRRNQIFFIWIP